jgi:hypothetical protein
MTAVLPSPTGIVVARMNGRACPTIYCGRCGASIAHAGHAIVAYPSDGHRVSFVILCRPYCSMAPEYRRWSWTGLNTFLHNLCANVKAA